MLPTTPNGAPATPSPIEAKLTDHTTTPRGVIQKNLKILLYLGAVVILVLATFVSSLKKKPAITGKASDTTTAPIVQDNTASNVATMHAQLGAERLQQSQDAQPAGVLDGTAAQRASAGAYGPNGLPVATAACPPGQPCSAEAQHFEIIGDTGTGKTTLIMQMLRQIQARKDSAIIYDPACEFVRRFYDPIRSIVPEGGTSMVLQRDHIGESRRRSLESLIEPGRFGGAKMEMECRDAKCIYPSKVN